MASFFYWFTRAPITNTTDWIASITKVYFLIFLEDGKSKIKLLADLVSPESPLFGLQTATFSLCPRRVIPSAVHSSGVFLGVSEFYAFIRTLVILD